MGEQFHYTPSGRPRARAIGIPFDGVPGPYNAVTDVAGVEVGYTTIIQGEGPLVVGRGPVRTGVTAILPRGRAAATEAVMAGFFSLNGNGELTGTVWIEEAGQCEGPITITNTHSCGVARDASLRWLAARFPDALNAAWGLPVAGETYDGYLNDINGFHVTAEHVFAAIDSARGGPVEEGSVGGGTGMICYEFKGGSGTASRVVRHGDQSFRVGVFVQANFGRREELVVAGVPIGRHITEGSGIYDSEQGSVIAVVATDAPLLPHQLKRFARRVGLGVGRSGSISGHGSGDIFLAFSTANPEALRPGDGLRTAEFLPQDALDPFFAAVVQATDEAVLNALAANETMTGRDGRIVSALPHDRVRTLLQAHNRLAAP